MEVYSFPSADLADYKTGLLGVGANWHPETLIDAYRKGIFPWPMPDFDEIPWFSPGKRAILNLQDFKLSTRDLRCIKNSNFKYTANKDFKSVIEKCSKIKRKKIRGNPNLSWITSDMQNAYIKLHELGSCHSIEVWQGKDLVGGVYGVLVNQIFAAESMFRTINNSSKAALLALVTVLNRLNLKYLDCQILSPHLSCWGVKEIEREEFLTLLSKNNERPPQFPNGEIEI